MARGILIAFATIVSLIGAVARAEACTCMTSGPPCQAFWNADAVFDATVQSIDATSRQENFGTGRPITVPEHLVHLTVSQGWKGVAAGPLDVITARDGAACGYDFKPGTRYLIFAHKRQYDGRWGVSLCSATREYDGTGVPAAFLAALSKPATGARVFGSVMATEPTCTFGETSTQGPVEARIRLLGGGRERTVTSTAGRFEFTGLAEGAYRLELGVPEGLSANVAGRTVSVPSERACAQADFYLQPSGRIVARVLNADGRPAQRTTIEVTTPASRPHPMLGLPKVAGQTDEHGDVEIGGLPPGRYIVGVNLRDLPSKYRPHARTLYPSEGEPTIVTLGVGQTYDLRTWTLPPPLAAVKVSGVVVWQDGTPAAGVYVSASDRTGNPVDALRAAGSVTSDENGQFVLELHQGRVYTFAVGTKDAKLLRTSAPRIETTADAPEPIRTVIRRDPGR